LSDDGTSMVGTVNLSPGECRVAFRRVSKLETGADLPDDQVDEAPHIVA
jgi:hypothetical protein